MLQIRPHRALGAYFLLATLLVAIYLLRKTRSTIHIDDGKWVITSGPIRKERPRLHVFLPTSTDNVNLCKSLLSATILDYPTPHLLAGNETLGDRYNLTGILRAAKIFHVYEHLQRLNPVADKDLVLVLESSDIWFQLRSETLIDRYVAVNADANLRIAERMGGAAYSEGIKQSIVFAAGKNCIPDDPHSLACNAVPETPKRLEIHSSSLASDIRQSKNTHPKQNYLTSGFAIGPVADMRAMFQRATEKVQAWPLSDPDSQAVFSTMFGEQESQREALRRQHETIFDKWHTKSSIRKARSSASTMSAAKAARNPSDTAQPDSSSDQTVTPRSGVSYEFGIGLDYFSDLSHATADAELDGQWLQYSESIPILRSQAESGQNDLSCKYHGDGKLPDDILHSPTPFPIEAGPGISVNKAWTQVPLYTNLCTNQVPVMIRNNGNQAARETNWPRLWLQRRARDLLQPKIYAENDREEGTEKGIKASLEEPLEAESEDYHTRLGAFTDDAAFKSWEQLCPSTYSAELFRD